MTDERMREVVARARTNYCGHPADDMRADFEVINGSQYCGQCARESDAICEALRAAGFISWSEARKACAKVAEDEACMCEEMRNEHPSDSYHWSFWDRGRKSADAIADAIRALRPPQPEGERGQN